MQESGEEVEATTSVEPHESSEQPDESNNTEPETPTATAAAGSKQDGIDTGSGAADLGLSIPNSTDVCAKEPSLSLVPQEAVESEPVATATTAVATAHGDPEREEPAEPSSQPTLANGNSDEGAVKADTDSQVEPLTEAQAEAEAGVQGEADAGSGADARKETEAEQESSLPSLEADEEPVEDAALPAMSEPTNAKPLSCLESVTAQFAPATKAAWAQIFGSRYEDEDQIDIGTSFSPEDAQETPVSVKNTIAAPKKSLQSKLERERRLDEQIQASQRRFRERQRRETASSSNIKAQTRGSIIREQSESHPSSQTSTPFKLAGLSLTQSRFCTEKALDETCRLFHRLHAAALDEPEELSSQSVQGVFVTQWELEHIIQGLFEPQGPTSTGSLGWRGTLVTPLGLTGEDNAVRSARIALETHLQASWFLPFGRLPQLRSLVMKITRRHLSEDKLAALNRELQKQATLLPLCAKLQQLVLRFSDHIESDPLGPWLPAKPRTAKPELRSSASLEQSFFECISVPTAAKTKETSEDDTSVLILTPAELLEKMQLSSVVSAQRLVFFRFLIESIAVERSRARSKPVKILRVSEALHSKSKVSKTDKTTGSHHDGNITKLRKKSGLRTKSSSRSLQSSEPTVPDKANEKPGCVSVDEVICTPRASSTLATHGSQQGASEADAEKSPADNPTQLQTQADVNAQGDQCDAPESVLQHQLEAAMKRLREMEPSIGQTSAQDVDPAIHTTYLAAAACHHSVQLMLDNDLALDGEMLKRLQHFIRALDAILQSSKQQIHAAVPTFAQTEDINHHGPVGDGPCFPPAYPESTVSEEEHEGSEASTNDTRFPPPYVSTTPHYWAFSPKIPSPKPSIAQSVNKSSSCCGPASVRRRIWPRDSPGVGAYDVQQGDKLTFPQRPSFSFGTANSKCSAGKHATPGNPTNATPSRRSLTESNPPKPRRWKKTSLAFVPPLLRSSSEVKDLGPQEPSGDDRDHVASQNAASYAGEADRRQRQVDISRHGPEGDAAEAPGEDNQRSDDDRVETDVLQALRLQQRMFVDEFVQQVVSRQEDTPPPANSSDLVSPTKSKTHWASSQISPGMERLLRRQRRAPSHSAPRVSMAFRELRPLKPKLATSPSNGRNTTKARRRAPPTPPPRRQLDNDQHLAWAARISELYQPQETASAATM